MPKTINEFDLERKEILNKFLQILEINENKKSFLLQDIDNNLEKQELIYNLEPDIKKYFLSGKWSCFIKSRVQQRKWYNMLKSICKDMNFNILSVKKNVKIDGKYVSFTECVFIKL